MIRILASLIIAVGWAESALANDHGPRLGAAVTQRIRVGLIVRAEQGACRGIVGTTPVPIDWPEQSVKIVDEQVTSHCKKISYRMVDNTARQMVIEIPQLPPGAEASALVTFEVTRHTLAPPSDTTIFTVPKKPDSKLRSYLTESPAIETRHGKIRALAKEAAMGEQGAWKLVESLYDTSRAKVQYKFGPLKGGLKALEDGEGDCEDISSLFIALCRINDIPARTVWVPGHCYPEFYLEDGEGNGFWFPCQAAGDRDFGGIPELRPILQKGDNFRVPEQRQRQRYVSEHFRAADVKGQPKVSFIREVVP